MGIDAVFMDGKGPSISDFTGGFDPGMATSKVQKMINDGVQMILPVAGPQTGDVTGIIAANKKIGDVFAFGVDTDQSLVYNPNAIMGSAVKGIYAATSFAIDALKKDPNHAAFPSFTYTMNGDAKHYFDDLKTRLKGNYIKGGMAENDAEFKASVRTMPTGFVPSAPNVSLNLRANDIYTKAIEALREDSANNKFDESGFGK